MIRRYKAHLTRREAREDDKRVLKRRENRAAQREGRPSRWDEARGGVRASSAHGRARINHDRDTATRNENVREGKDGQFYSRNEDDGAEMNDADFKAALARETTDVRTR